MKNKLVLNSAEDAEIISVRLDPIAYANKVECLMLSGLSEEEAKKEAMMPIDLELYYEVGVESCQSDWFKIDKEIFMLPENKNKIFILGTRKTGCDLIMLGGTNCNEITMDRVFGCLGNEKFYVCQPISLYKTQQNIQERPALYVFKIATAYFREQGLVPVFEDCHCKLMKL